jgi:hypothetical protein
MNAEGSEIEPLTLTEIAVYLGLIKNSQTNLSKKRIRKKSSKTQQVQLPIEYSSEDDGITLHEPEEDGTNQSIQQSNAEIIASRKYTPDEAEDKRSVQEIDIPDSAQEKIKPRIDYDSHEILDLCFKKIREINNRLRYLDEFKIDENYEPELITEISDQRNVLLEEYKKINELILILQNEEKDNSLEDVVGNLPQPKTKPEYLEEKYEPLPETKPNDMDWFVKSILQLTRALNQRYPFEDNSIQVPKDEHWFVETILQLIKLDEHARFRSPLPEPAPRTISTEEKPQQETTQATTKNTEDTINDRINSRVSSLMREIQEIENKYKKAIQTDHTSIEAHPYTPPSVRMSTESETVNERLRNLESKFNNFNVRKAQLARELTNMTASIDTLKPKKTFKDYPRRGVLALGISAVLLGLLILFPIQSPFLLQYIFGVGFALIGGGIIIDSIWVYLERRDRQ